MDTVLNRRRKMTPPSRQILASFKPSLPFIPSHQSHPSRPNLLPYSRKCPKHVIQKKQRTSLTMRKNFCSPSATKKMTCIGTRLADPSLSPMFCGCPSGEFYWPRRLGAKFARILSDPA